MPNDLERALAILPGHPATVAPSARPLRRRSPPVRWCVRLVARAGRPVPVPVDRARGGPVKSAAPAVIQGSRPQWRPCTPPGMTRSDGRLCRARIVLRIFSIGQAQLCELEPTPLLGNLRRDLVNRMNPLQSCHVQLDKTWLFSCSGDRSRGARAQAPEDPEVTKAILARSALRGLDSGLVPAGESVSEVGGGPDQPVVRVVRLPTSF